MTSILALTITLLLAGISAAAIFAATQVTAKSELFRGTRNRLLDYALDLTGTYLARDALDEATWAGWLWTEFMGKVADLANCAFCQTFWHAIWITLGTAYLLGVPNGFAVAAWLPAIAFAKLIHDKGTKRQIKRHILTEPEEHDLAWFGIPAASVATPSEKTARITPSGDYEPGTDLAPNPRGDTTVVIRQTYKKDT